MKEDARLRGHVPTFGCMGGSAFYIKPYNPKAGVKRHPKEGDVEFNDADREMATPPADLW